MNNPMFRDLTADEIECRVAKADEYGVLLLPYKDARCDQNILDETVGAMNWMQHHITSGTPPHRLIMSCAVSFPMSATNVGLNDLSQSTVNTLCPLASNAFAIDFVPQKRSSTIIQLLLAVSSFALPPI